MDSGDAIFVTGLTPPVGTTPLAVKDLFDTAGVRTTYGSSIFAEHVPQVTATAVARLEAAGYGNAGKANLHEFAWGITSENDFYGWVPNPIAPGRTPGGSSGGCAAALAAGLVDAALGTDSGGSIRLPAACCGVVGFKPSHGLVPLDGCWPLAPSFDHAGPMARDVAACERMLAALAPGFAAAPAPDLADLRVGVLWLDGADALVRGRVEAAAALCGSVTPLDVPLPDGTYDQFAREAADVHRRLFAERRADYGPNVAAKLERAMGVTAEDAARAARARERYRELMARLIEQVDLLIAPTMEMVAPPSGLGDLALRERMIKLTYPANATGAPALALPCGAAEDGLPASFQLIGRVGDDAAVLAAGRALEAALTRR